MTGKMVPDATSHLVQVPRRRANVFRPHDAVELFLADPRAPGPPNVTLDVIIIVCPGTCRRTVKFFQQLQPTNLLFIGSDVLTFTLTLGVRTGRTIQYCRGRAGLLPHYQVSARCFYRRQRRNPWLPPPGLWSECPLPFPAP